MLVTARRFIRKMRGGAQAHLMEADDGHFYVVKFTNNPQHRRILINESIAAAFLEHLEIAAPPVAAVALSEEFLAEHPDIFLQFGKRREPVPPGWHFGSRFPGDPATLAVYDFLPDALLDKVENRADYLGVLAFDKWLGNADARQSVFFRARIREWTAAPDAHPLRQGFVSLMIDHGFVFNGPHWEFVDSPLQGLYFRPLVYSQAANWDAFQPWLTRIENFPEEVFDRALKRIPPAWIGDDAAALEQLLERLWNRRRKVRDLLDQCRRERAHLFPAWR